MPRFLERDEATRTPPCDPYPWDGADPVSLLNHADQLALQSKKKGKNVITIGPGGRKQS